MKSATKAMIMAGVAAFMILAGGEDAEAKPVLSSWYGPGFEGRVTASGEVYRAGAYTAAHPRLPFGTKLLTAVCYVIEPLALSIHASYQEDLLCKL